MTVALQWSHQPWKQHQSLCVQMGTESPKLLSKGALPTQLLSTLYCSAQSSSSKTAAHLTSWPAGCFITEKGEGGSFQ
jgi:hypothetical protein